MTLTTAIVVIPARGGSKGIPRKCLRPIAGKPMIYYAINAAKSASSKPAVCVTTDDDEIALFAERFGAYVIRRPAELATDEVTLDPVVVHAYEYCRTNLGIDSEVVLTVQPTSPLVRCSDIDEAVRLMLATKADTILSVADDRHLCWTIRDGRYIPVYKERVNRQYLPPNFRETGAIIGCSSDQILTGTRIGRKIELLMVDASRSFDIDSIEDLVLCESVLRRRKIVFVVTGHHEVGLGHVYRALMIANELVAHDLSFVVDSKSMLAWDIISKRNFRVRLAEEGEVLAAVREAAPDLVINDILDTTEGYVNSLKGLGAKVINFEDLGAGGGVADLVINALYPSVLPYKQIKSGHEYFWLRDEFRYVEAKAFGAEVRRILITFGGVDEPRLAIKVIKALESFVIQNNIIVYTVMGPGNRHVNELDKLHERLPKNLFVLIGATSRISDYMAQADFAITSGGRTVLELTAMHVPTLTICQNLREMSHLFISRSFGVVNLGLHSEVQPEDIMRAVQEIVRNESLRKSMYEAMCSVDLQRGRDRILQEIHHLIG